MLRKHEPQTVDIPQVMPVGKTKGLLNQIKLRVPFEMMLLQFIGYIYIYIFLASDDQ
jgi:hypothetical protein